MSRLPTSSSAGPTTPPCPSRLWQAMQIWLNTLGGKPLRSISPIHLRKATMASISSSVKVVLHHAPLAGIHGLRVAQHGLDELRPAPFVHLGQFRRVVGTLAQDGVAAHAVVPVPQVLAGDRLRRQVVGVGLLRHAADGVERQQQKDDRKPDGADQKERPCGGFRKHDLTSQAIRHPYAFRDIYPGYTSRVGISDTSTDCCAIAKS